MRDSTAVPRLTYDKLSDGEISGVDGQTEFQRGRIFLAPYGGGDLQMEWVAALCLGGSSIGSASDHWPCRGGIWRPPACFERLSIDPYLTVPSMVTLALTT